MPVTLVLGATGGIGSALTRRLAAAGHQLVIGARGAERLSALAGETGAAAFTLDATEPDGVESLVQHALDEHGQLDGMVNCVGSILLKPAHLTTPGEFEDVLRVNLLSAFLALRAAARPMQQQKSGSIVLVSSVAAKLGLANHEAIAAAKGGIMGMVGAAAATYARAGVRVNAVAPGLVRTPLTERMTKTRGRRGAVGAATSAGPHRRAGRRGGDHRAPAQPRARRLDHRPDHLRRWRLRDRSPPVIACRMDGCRDGRMEETAQIISCAFLCRLSHIQSLALV